MKKFLYFLDPPEQDAIEERISKEPIVNKYWLHIGGSIILLLGTIVLFVVSVNNSDIKPAKTYEVNLDEKKQKVIRTLPFPQESAKHRMAWVNEAIMKSYSFDFLNIDRNLRAARYYFTEDSYKKFLDSIEKSKIRERVKNDKLEVSVVPLMDPIFISRQDKGDSRIWHYRVPVLISYYGGVNVVSERKNIELRVVRNPIHQNPKGLEILSFMITGPTAK